MKKKLLILFIFIAIFILPIVLYLGFAFAEWSFDPLFWHDGARGVLVVFWVLMGGLMIGISTSFLGDEKEWFK